jgi:hypothetical protein
LTIILSVMLVCSGNLCAGQSVPDFSFSAHKGASTFSQLLSGCAIPVVAPSASIVVPVRSFGERGAVVSDAQLNSMIRRFAESARSKKKEYLAKGLEALAQTGTRQEKEEFLFGKNEYIFPDRFMVIAERNSNTVGKCVTRTVCEWGTETLCTTSCWITSNNMQECMEDCRNLLVKTCETICD